jgi:hypothetical protein
VGHWMFIFEEDGAMRHIPQRISIGLAIGSQKLPEYAGRRLRYANVIVSTENRRPAAIERIEGSYFSFDKRGGVQEGLARGAMGAMTTFEDALQEKAATGPVTSIAARIARKKWEREHRWTPSRADIDRICAVIWPKRA